jgi:hypothetical protein
MKFEWEIIGTDFYDSKEKSKKLRMTYGQVTQKAKVFGGWKVQTIYNNNIGNSHQSSIFVPDVDHLWGKEK